MTSLRVILVYTLVAVLFVTSGFISAQNQQPAPRPSITIMTDRTWEVGSQKTKFGEYPLSAGQIPSATSPLYGGSHKAVAAEHHERSKIIPGTVPIWRRAVTDSEGEACQLRKTVSLGADPIRKATLQINCDDVARVYINKRLVSVEKRDGTIKDGYDDWYTFRSVTGFTQSRIYTYDVTDYFFTNIVNTIVIEAVSLAFDGSHAYVSAKFVLEFDPLPLPAEKPKPKATPKPKPETTANPASPAVPVATPNKSAAPANVVFEAGRDPEIESLRVGSVLELGHVFFKADDYKLDSASYRTLDALAAFMKRHPKLKIEVGGHTNLRPTDSFAARLSENRARAVARYLTDNGVAAGRVSYKGYGKSRPRINAVSKEADAANQRVEVKVLEK
jgi:outer membrane protein OmpA-like peptidoglycan-associated protein